MISLLLVTCAEGDVADVMFRVLAGDRLEFHYAKNTRCTADEKEYVEKLFGIVRDMNASADAAGNITRWELLNLVIHRCKRKIKSRLKKIRKRLREIYDAASSVLAFANRATPYFAITGSACSTDSETWLRDGIGESIFSASGTLQRFLQGWFTSVYNRQPAIFKDWHIASVHYTLRIAYYVGQTPDITSLLDSTLLSRARKLRDFYAATLTLLSMVAQLPNFPTSPPPHRGSPIDGAENTSPLG